MISRVLLIDDNEQFVKGAKRRWEQIIKPQQIYPNCECEFRQVKYFEDIFAEVESPEPPKYRHILIDASLLGEEEGAEHLQRLCDAQLQAKLWLFTGYVQIPPDELRLWEQWRAEFQALQGDWFEKNLLWEQVLATLKSSDTSAADIKFDWEDIPVPCRYFDKDFNPVSTNKLWQLEVNAFPSGFRAPQKDDLVNTGQSSVEVWCEIPNQQGAYGHVQFITRKLKDGEGYLQTALVLSKPRAPQEPGKPPLAATEVIDLLLGSKLFTRARYYEVLDVPDMDKGVLRLYWEQTKSTGHMRLEKL